MTALAALLWAIALVPIASADGGESEPAGGWQWVGQPDAIPLEDSVVRLVQGEAVAGGCRFSGEEIAGLDPRPVLERSLAMNLETCQMRVERGYVGEAWRRTVAPGGSGHVPNGGAGTATATEVAEPAPAAEDVSGDVGTLVTRRRHAWHRTWWEDPIGIVVNSAEPNVRWSYDFSCGFDSDHWTHYTWYTTSGWTKQSSNTQAYQDCNSRTTSSYAHFKNGVFCIGFDTHAYYDRTVIVGRPDGGYYMSWNSWVSGSGCKDLLSFHRTHGYTQIY